MKVVNSMKWGSLILALVSANAFAQTIDNRIMIHKEGRTGTFTTSANLGVPGNTFTLDAGETFLSGPLASSDTPYTLTEQVPVNARISSIVCIQDDEANAIVTITGSTLANAQPGRFDAGDNVISVTFSATDPDGTGPLEPVQAPGETVQCTIRNEPEGGIKIIKDVTWNRLEVLPAQFDFWKDSAGTANDLNFSFHFDATNDFPAGTAAERSIRQLHKFFPNEAAGTHVFYELAPLIPDLIAGGTRQSNQWKVTSINCTCDGEACGDKVTVQLDDGTVLTASAVRPATTTVSHPGSDVSLAKLTVDLEGGELVICTVMNEDVVCPPELGGPAPAPGSSNNSSNNSAATNNTNAGLATTNTGSSDSAGGCSSTGTGVAGLTTILMLLASLVGVRAMRRVRVK
jgi:hypothetical protein